MLFIINLFRKPRSDRQFNVVPLPDSLRMIEAEIMTTQVEVGNHC